MDTEVDHQLVVEYQCGEDSRDQGPSELNYWKFRLGVTLQDLAQLKIEIGKAEDSTYHLQASEK